MRRALCRTVRQELRRCDGCATEETVRSLALQYSAGSLAQTQPNLRPEAWNSTKRQTLCPSPGESRHVAAGGAVSELLDVKSLPFLDPEAPPYENHIVSADEAPHRLREMAHVTALWKASLMNPGRRFDDLTSYMKAPPLWRCVHANLAGASFTKTLRNSPVLREGLNARLAALRDAVFSGRYAWKGQGEIFLQGRLRQGLELRRFRSDVEGMADFVAAQRRKKRPRPFDLAHQRMLEGYFQDRVVTEVLKLVLEAVFEPTFADCSHGFRPGRTQHTALRYVRRELKDAAYFYRTDLRSVFDLLQENRRKFVSRLRSVLEKRVTDVTFLTLLLSGLESGSIASSYDVTPTDDDCSPLTVKSGILPLLCNIYFDPLDQWVAQKGRQLRRGRFADDVLVGIEGSQELALCLRAELREFADHQLGVVLPANALRKAEWETLFLGHILQRKPIVLQPSEAGAEKAVRPVLTIKGDRDKMMRLLARAGYCLKNAKPVPNYKHYHFPQSETNGVIRKMLQSICDFYRVARNRRRIVAFCSFVLRHSVAKMYAAKYKLRTRAQVFKRAGKDLSGRVKQFKGRKDGVKSSERFPVLPYGKVRDVPLPDLRPLPEGWQPEMMTGLCDRLLGTKPQF